MSFIPYRNGVVKITKDKIDLIPYIDIDGYVWDSHILQRNYYYEAYNNNDFKVSLTSFLQEFSWMWPILNTSKFS